MGGGAGKGLATLAREVQFLSGSFPFLNAATSVMDIQDHRGNPVDIARVERSEQDLANRYIEENDVVLELGARYGSVSCIINSKLNCKTNQVVVEPDSRVWDALERNRRVNGCEFHIVKGFVSGKRLALTDIDSYGGYGATTVEDLSSSTPSFTLEEIQQKYNLKFNVLIADCEGFLETFFDENPGFYDGLRLIIFEQDYPNKCNYEKIRSNLIQRKFSVLLEQKGWGGQNVWINRRWPAL